jgi:hypothetical protein
MQKKVGKCDSYQEKTSNISDSKIMQIITEIIRKLFYNNYYKYIQ